MEEVEWCSSVNDNGGSADTIALSGVCSKHDCSSWSGMFQAEWPLASCTCSLCSSCFLAVRSWRRVLLSCTASSVAFSQSWRGSALASKSFICDRRFWNTHNRENYLQNNFHLLDSSAIMFKKSHVFSLFSILNWCFRTHEAYMTDFHFTKSWEKMLTCKPVSLLCRLDMRLFQSSLALFTLARTASTLSLAAILVTSSPLTTTAFSFDWPCSLSFRNSCWEKSKRGKMENDEFQSIKLLVITWP